ncbi:DUF833-domain-containing protein [Patellaria atrata CBS 101060]|uniref:DUF833-domain-containing protein n=1 Tax=Patellaria atrata CBS 101060 TaxID=1346257 RepID=A0A9P4SIJ5_9PEZI|nr:DUF833-domain-containing protein [Patellaria atrata CBS 101060]
MCIAIVTTAHPQFPFILLSNRDEFLGRPTAPAGWWQTPNEHVLGGRDLRRPEQGTWLGINRDGRFAVLTNYREEGQVIYGVKSRGGIIKDFLTTPLSSEETTEEYARQLFDGEGVNAVGGFNLLFGKIQDIVLRTNKGLAIVSNRTADIHSVSWIASQPGETHAMSNSWYGDNSWPKIVHGERLTKEAISESVEKEEDKDTLIERLFVVLHTDTLPRPKPGETLEIYLRQLQNSIFIPTIGGPELDGTPADAVAAAKDHKAVEVDGGLYGTHQQSIILVDQKGMVTYVERTLARTGDNPNHEKDTEKKYEFRIEGW